jgi:hypothetical protein
MYVYNDPAAVAEQATGSGRRSATQPAPVASLEPQPTPDLAPLVAPSASAAVAVLGALRLRDPRLLLSGRDVARLSPAVEEWFRLGVVPDRVVDALCTGLPEGIVRRPAGLLAYRLESLKPVDAEPLRSHTVLPMQNCDRCDRGFRAERPGWCRDCAMASAAA